MFVWYATCDCLQYPVRGGGTTVKRFDTQADRNRWAEEHRRYTSHRVLTYRRTDDDDPPITDPNVIYPHHEMRDT